MAVFDFLFGKKQTPEAPGVATPAAPNVITEQGSVLPIPTSTLKQQSSLTDILPTTTPKQAEQNIASIKREGTIDAVQASIQNKRKQSIPRETAAEIVDKNPDFIEQHFKQFSESGIQKKETVQKKLNSIQRSLNMSIDVQKDPFTGDTVPTDESIEVLKNEYYRLRSEEAERTNAGEAVGAFASNTASALDYLTGKQGTFNTTRLGRAELIKSYLDDTSPDDALDLQLAKFEGESPTSRAVGTIASEFAMATIPGTMAAKTMRALPIITKLRGGTRLARLTAIGLENIAADLGAQGFFTAKSGGSIEDLITNVAANPSTILAYHKKWHLFAGLAADITMGKILGMTTQEAITNAAIAAGGGILQRAQSLNDLGYSQLRQSVEDGLKNIHIAARSQNLDLNTVNKMTMQLEKNLMKEARLLGFKTEETRGLFGENRLVNRESAQPGGQNQKSPEGGRTPELEGTEAVPTKPSQIKKTPEQKAFDDVVAENLKKRKVAEGKKNIVTKSREAIKNLKTQLIDRFAPIEDALNSVRKQTSIRPEYDPSAQINRTLRSDAIANDFLETQGFNDILRNTEDLDGLSEYLIARQSQDIERLGITSGRDLETDKILLKNAPPEIREAANKVTAITRDMLDAAAKPLEEGGLGLIDVKTANRLKQRYKNYVPLNRIFSEEELETAFKAGSSRGPGSISKQTVIQKLEGSERVIEDPLTSIIERIGQMFHQGEINRTGWMISKTAKLPGNPLELKPLRLAENVNKRIELFSENKELKPIQNKLKKMIQSRSKNLRKLQTEYNNLQKKSVTESTRNRASSTPEVRSGVKLKTFKTTSKVSETLIPAIPSKKELKQFLQKLVNEEPSILKKLKKMSALREKKMQDLIEEIERIKNAFDDVVDRRAENFDEIKLLKDAESRGKSTISFINNGIKEIWETTPEIAAAAKSLSVDQMGIIARVASIFTRIFKVGTTGLRPAFTLVNIARDQITGLMNANFARNFAHSFPKALWASLTKNDLYRRIESEAALNSTIFDIGRPKKNKTVQSIASTKSRIARASYLVRNPKELFRAIEDVFGQFENMARIQSYLAEESGLRAQGRAESDIRVSAQEAARKNTGDFLRFGNLGRSINSILPYLNASKEGIRSMLRAAQNDPGKFAMKFGIIIGMPTVTWTAWNLSDEKRKAAYMDIEEYEKQGNLIWIPPNPEQDENGNWKVVKVPVAQNLLSLAAPLRRSIEIAHDVAPLELDQIIQDLNGTVNPIPLPLDEQTRRQAANQVVPQPIKPIIESTVNQNLFTGAPLVPDFLQQANPEDQFKEGTTQTARFIGRAFGVSPAKTENFLRGYFGPLSTDLLGTSDNALEALGIIGPGESRGTGVGENVMQRLFTAKGGKSGRVKGITPQSTRDLFIPGLTSEAKKADVNILPPYLGGKFSYKGKEIQLNQNQYDELSTVYANTLNQVLPTIFNSDVYQNADRETKNIILTKTKRKILDQSKKQFIAKNINDILPFLTAESND